MTDIASNERAELAELMHQTGPLADTLCDGWNARDLAAHLYVRENEPWNAAGILLKPLAGVTERAMRKAQQQHDFDQLVSLIAAGPKGLSPFRISAVDKAANGFEFFVHHEDVRRAQPGWAPRTLAPDVDQQLWDQLLPLAKTKLRGAKVGIIFVRTRDGEPTGDEHVVSLGPGVVKVIGDPAELTMWFAGRGSHADVKFDGPQANQDLIKKIQLKV